MSRILKISVAIVILSALIGGMIALAQGIKQPPTELYVRTVPPGAVVLIDGEEVGKSNDLFEVKPGERQVEVKLDGYKPAAKPAIVPATRIERVEFELEKLAGGGPAVVASDSTEAGNKSALLDAIRKAKVEYSAVVEAFNKKDWPAVDRHANEMSDILRDEVNIVSKLDVIRVRCKEMRPGKGKQAMERKLKMAQCIRDEIKTHLKNDVDREAMLATLRGIEDFGDDLHDSIRDGKIEQAPMRFEALRQLWETFDNARFLTGKDNSPSRMHFVRIVVGNDRMTFEGKDTTWEQLSGLLEKVPRKNQTVLELAVASDEISLKKKNSSVGIASDRARQLGFKYLSFIGVHQLGSKGSPSQIVERETTNILTNPSAELGDKKPEGWKQGAAIPGVKYSWDKETACEGKASLCIEKTAQRYFPIAAWTQTIEWKRNAPAVELSAQVKTEKMTKAVLDVLFLDENDKWISHKWAAYIGSKENNQPPATHDWKRYAGKVEVPPATAKIVAGLQVYGPGKVWFDDVRLVEVEENSDVSASQTGSKAARDAMIALVEKFFRNNFRDVTTRKTIEWGNVKKHPDGNRSIRYKYLATFHRNPEKVVVNQVFTFDKDDKFVDYENVEGPEGEGKAGSDNEAKTKRRAVGKKVADFPESLDLSTPESAWSAFHRALGRMDVKGLAKLVWGKPGPAQFARMKRIWKESDPEELAVYNKALLEAECVEILTYRDEVAAVISNLPFPPGKGRHPYSSRLFILIDGKWKNKGEDRYPSLEAARAGFEKKKILHWAHFSRIKEQQEADKPKTTSVAPRPIETQPKITATDVDPNLKEIRATFDRDMNTDSFSFCGGGPHFPKTAGKAKWINRRTCVLPVELEEGKAYRLALNWEQFQGFRSADGRPAKPTVLYFCTRGAGPETVAMMTPPKVARLSIANSAKDVPPGRTKLSVTFDRAMGVGMSWCCEPDMPKLEPVKGSAWSDDKKTCSIHALLEPGKSYTIYLNSEKFGNFMNELGVSLEPVTWKFSTSK